MHTEGLISGMSALVSVLIPACGRAAYLMEAIESVLNQGYSPLEILIGDDSADEACERMVAGLAGTIQLRAPSPWPSPLKGEGIQQQNSRGEGVPFGSVKEDRGDGFPAPGLNRSGLGRAGATLPAPRREVAGCSSIALRYTRNSPPLGQAGNINRLIDQARGRRILLLHDDDRLMPGAIEAMARIWDLWPGVTAVYGDQQAISEDGATLETETEALNATYHRSPQYAGLQASAISAALLQQFPNDGYMVETGAARAVRFREYADVGTYCDFDFGVRLALTGAQFYYVPEYTCQYRLSSGNSISTSGSEKHRFSAEKMYDFIRDLKVNGEDRAARSVALGRLAPIVAASHSRRGKRLATAGVYCAPWYPRAPLLSKRGLGHLLMLMFPSMRMIAARWRPSRPQGH